MTEIWKGGNPKQAFSTGGISDTVGRILPAYEQSVHLLFKQNVRHCIHQGIQVSLNISSVLKLNNFGNETNSASL